MAPLPRRTVRALALRLVTLVLPATFLGASCDRFIPLETKGVLDRLEKTPTLVGAYELEPACALELSTAPRAPEGPAGASGWRGVARNELFGRTLTVLERRPITRREKGKDLVYALLRVTDGSRGAFWLRNRPAETKSDAQTRWACLATVEEATESRPQPTGPRVALAAQAWGCTDVAPLFGGRRDVTFDPYTVGTPSLVVTGDGKLYTAVPLHLPGEDRYLTVTGPTLDRCFATTVREAPLPSVEPFLAWARSPLPEATLPPPVTQDVALALTGLDLRRCELRKGAGPGSAASERTLCKAPLLDLTTLPEAGPFGPPRVRLVRERFVETMVFRAGTVVSSEEAVTSRMVVRLQGASTTRTPGLAAALTAELSKRTPGRVRNEVATGARLEASTPTKGGATHTVDVDLRYTIPDADTGSLRGGDRPPTLAAPGPVDGDAFEAQAAPRAADAELAFAQAVHAVRPNDEARRYLTWAEARARKGRGPAPSPAAPVAKASTDPAPSPGTPKAQAAHLRRGSAILSVTITRLEGKRVELRTESNLPFVARHPDRAPTVAEVERAVASSLAARLEELLVRWEAQTRGKVDVGEVVPGSRSYLLAAARQAAGGAPVALLADGAVALGAASRVRHGFQVHEDDPERCFVFAASGASRPEGPRPEIRLTVGRAAGERLLPLSEDRRGASAAAAMACHLGPGSYGLEVSLTPSGGEASPRYVALSVFEATPGEADAKDLPPSLKGVFDVAPDGAVMTLTPDGVSVAGPDGKPARLTPGVDKDADGVLDDP